MTTAGWLALAVVGIFPAITVACPDSCSCKWKNGKQTAICTRKSLSDIPDHLDPGTQVLDFAGNSMPLLPDELFRNKQLINLQKIYLSDCQIKIINEKTFKGLTNLVELDLSRNSLDAVPTASFAYCPSLMRLTLSSNPIKALKKASFSRLSFLNTLELRGCRIREVEEGTFQGLHSLEWLLLDDNELKTIPGADTLPPNLKGLELRGNPWECDCHIKELHSWLAASNTPISVEPTCRGPARLSGRPVKSIPALELACLPDVSPTTFYLELAEGKNVSLQCHVHSVPEAAVSWWFRGQVLQNNTVVAPGIHLIYFVEEGAENKRSELFIYNANAEDNGTFVCNAENAAGTSQSNFTIKIVVREEPIVIIVSFPFEYLLAGAVGAAALGLVTAAVAVVSIVRCRRRRREERRSKEVKSEEVPEPNPPKEEEVEQPECDPDLINGMECRREGDVRWVGVDGYPLDYGLPKTGYYRTLPHRVRRQSLPRPRYSQEAEFLARNSLPLYDHYHQDVRYTAEGYPVLGDAPSSLPYCPVQWASCEVVGKRCVGAQTEDEAKIDSNARNEAANEALTESPDEGYEGEPSVV